MDQKEKLAALLSDALGAEPFNLQKSPADLVNIFESPRDSSLGDWAFPCFTLARDMKKKPQEIAPLVKTALQEKQKSETWLAGVEAVGPYLNFRLARSTMAAEILPSVLQGDFLAHRPARQERIMVEYSQPNTHKAFHVGHTRCASYGDNLVRIFEWLGHSVTPVNYIGDEGTHVARCLWYFLTQYKGEVPNHNRGEFLGELYSAAFNMLSLGSLTEVPIPGVTAARVLEIRPHPAEPKWTVVRLSTADGQKTVVCGGSGFRDGDLVAYAKPGMRLGSRAVGVIEKNGITSEGMICSESELELSSDNQKIAVLPEHSKVGDEVAEIFRIAGALPAEIPVLVEHARREAEVSRILQKMEGGDPEIKELWQKTRQWSIDEFHEIYAWLNCRFDHYFYESEFGETAKTMVRKYLEKGVFVESEGAIGADLRDENLGFCILIKRDGTATYAARDLALAQKKFEQYGIDRSLYVVDSAQTLHFQQVFSCLRRMGYAQAGKCAHLGYAQVVLPDGKMSSRKGNVILFSKLQEGLLSRIHSEFLDKYRGDWSDEEIETAGKRIALSAIRYGMSKQENGSLIVFDLNEWTGRSGNTGPYMMYAYARTRSILREAGAYDIAQADWSLLKDPTEEDLLLHLSSFQKVVQKAGDTYSPHLICSYIYELSKRFNKMYAQCPVLKAESAALRVSRLALVEASGLVIRAGLGLVGIPTVERM